MTELTKLEQAALLSIISEKPDIASGLCRQFEGATVADRENTGRGFFTTINVAEDAPRVSSPNVLGYETHAHVKGMEYGLGFVLFMKDGALSLLEGYALAGTTSGLDLTDLVFDVFRVPENQPVPASPFNSA